MKKQNNEKELVALQLFTYAKKDYFGFNLYFNIDKTNPNYAHIHARKGDKIEIVYDFNGNVIHNNSTAAKEVIEILSKWIHDKHQFIKTEWNSIKKI